MIFELPHNHTTVLIGQLDLQQMATDTIRGHINRSIKANERPDVLIVGFSPLNDMSVDTSEPYITFVSEDTDSIPSRRYSLIVVNIVSQTVFNNGLIQIEVPRDQHTVLQRLASVGIPFLAIVE